MKKVTALFIIIGAIVVSGYLYLRHSLSTKGFRPVVAQKASNRPLPPESKIDLRPKLIARLQQLVKAGSNGLYNLSIHEVEPDIIASNVIVRKITLIPDTAALKKLEELHQAPDDVFKIFVDSLRIDGMGISDLVNNKNIDLKSIYFSKPTIEVFHKKRAYNEKKKEDTVSLYKRLIGQMDRLAIHSVQLDNGNLTTHNTTNHKTANYRGISVKLSDILIDSVSQHDNDRFLFAKQADISLKHFTSTTLDNLYTFKIDHLSVSATRHQLSARNLSLIPLYSKQSFSHEVKKMTERYSINVPSLQAKNIDWQGMINNEGIHAEEMSISNAHVSIYLDMSLRAGKVNIHGFPHQMLMKIATPLNVSKLNLENLSVTYEEYHPKVQKSGVLSFDHIDGTIYNIANAADGLKSNAMAVFRGSGNFMHHIPLKATLRFDLAHYKTGAFSSDIEVGAFDGTQLNSFTVPMGMIMIKRGEVQSAKAHIEGDNYKGASNVLLLYHDLHITPLKGDKDRASGFKKKSLTSLVANTLVIKDQNPSKGEAPRYSSGTYDRKGQGTFFNMLWKTAFVSVLKTLGIPEKYVYK